MSYMNKVPLKRVAARDMEATNNHIARMQTVKKNPERAERDSNASSNVGRRDSSVMKNNRSTASTNRTNSDGIQRRSGLDKYKKKAENRVESSFEGRTSMNLAPPDQFRKYLDDDTNVFYEDSDDFNKLRRVKVVRFYLSAFLTIAGLLYFFVGRIIPFPLDECPRNADCRVFIHCHSGYVRVNEQCIIDPEIVNKAKKISDVIVDQLSFNLGNSECAVQPISNSMKIYQVFSEFNVEDDLLKNEIANYFQNRIYQREKNFVYEFNKITAREKKYSLICQLQLYYQSPAFNYYFVGTIACIFLMILAARTYQYYKNIRDIYAALKERVLKDKIIRIDDHKAKIQSRFGKWNQEIWMAVDRCRFEDGQIVYFIDSDDVYWKAIS